MNRRFNLCMAVLVGLCMLPVPGAFAQATLTPDQYEPNNTQSQSTVLGNLALNIPVVIHANLHGAEDQGDWYVTRGSAGSLTGASFRLVVLLTGPSPDNMYDLTLLSKPDGSGSQSQEVFSISGTNTAERVYPLNFACGTFNTSICPKTLYLQVRRASGNTANESYDLTVTLLQGSALPPEVTNITPTSGPVGTTVTIAGTRFSGTTAVKFQGIPSTFIITGDDSISATVPSGATTGLISVSTLNGGSTSSSSNFTVTSETAPPPSTGDTSSASPSSKKGGISPMSPDKKQPPSVKSGTTQTPSNKLPDAKAAKKRKDPTSNCVGLGCGKDTPTCIGLGCGEDGPICIGMGCEKKGAVNPKETGPIGTATLPSIKKPTIYGATPCCSIVNIADSGLVTAKDTATGNTFQFQAKGRGLMTGLRIGQKIHADFGTQQVSVDGAAPCCAIVSASGGSTGAATIP